MDEALLSFQKRGLHPEHADSYFQTWACSWDNKGERDDALEAYLSCLDLNPNHEWAHQNLVALYTAKGMVRQAIDACESSLRLHPDNPEILTNLGPS